MDQKMKVYVTGASGFLASWLVKRHLLSGKWQEAGTSVGLEGARERLTLARADLMEEGGFDRAIMGCHGVFHTASPAEILVPAVEGTLNVLRSCKKNPSLRRVVLTSSTSAVRARDDFDPKIPLQDESSWSSVEFCERLQGRLRNADGLEGWNMFTSMMLHSATSILVYEHEDAHGRYLCSSAELDDNELTSLLSARYPSLPIPKRSDALDIPYVEFNTSKLKSLGFKFKSIQDMFDDCIASLVEEGHLGQV
uniref:NAD-dependent epimerase/dehydratase domain-containing protein n=1 Tax=Vitis vinifera TaxID=29760 RepID=F6I0N7_VITVI